MHDSVFIQQELDIKDKDVIFLWKFKHDWNNHYEEEKIISNLADKELLHHIHHHRDKWEGCFGVMSVIKHSFLKHIYERHDLNRLLDHINCRYARMHFERIFPVICYLNSEKIESLFGDIHQFIKCGYTYENYKSEKQTLPIVKVWSGR